jgi:hypothetical protein
MNQNISSFVETVIRTFKIMEINKVVKIKDRKVFY